MSSLQHANAAGQPWDGYKREVDNSPGGWVALLHPTAKRGDVVEMTWPQFRRVAALLQEERHP